MHLCQDVQIGNESHLAPHPGLQIVYIDPKREKNMALEMPDICTSFKEYAKTQWCKLVKASWGSLAAGVLLRGYPGMKPQLNQILHRPDNLI